MIKKLAFCVITTLFFCTNSLAENPEENKNSQTVNYYTRSKGYSSNPESDPPHYAYQLDQTGIDAFKDVDWVDAGLNYRMRFEHRKNDFRRSDTATDNVFLSRTQAYFGIKNIIDPLRFAIELQDSRQHNSHYKTSTGDVNKLDVFQGYGELYFKEPVFLDRPISLRYGRMAFESVDRKLIARDDWGNTGTNFQGLRTIIGTKENDWQLDSFALNPMVKKTNEADSSNEDLKLYATILSWRKWSDQITLQPFYLKLDGQQNSQKTNLQSPGLRFYGTLANNHFDYDFLAVYQLGTSEGKDNNAYGYATELGYTLQHKWQPRFSMIYGYASGDKNPYDNKNQRFNRFYGFNRAWSNSNTIEWENLKTIKSRIEFQPHKKIRMESSYSFYWLASKTDSWTRANLQDKSGSSGNSIGQDFDFRTHYKVSKHLKTTLGYAHFISGEFTRKVGRGGESDFIYLELTLNVFGQ